jgi:hypothetical protein
MMEANHSNASLFSDTDIDCLFGLRVDFTLHQRRVAAAEVFTKIRSHIEMEMLKLKTLSATAFHKSARKKTFRHSVENVAAQNPESKFLITLVEGSQSSKDPSPLDIFLVLCWSLSETHYTKLDAHELTSISPRLFLAVLKDITLRDEVKTLMVKIIKEVFAKAGDHNSILS